MRADNQANSGADMQGKLTVNRMFTVGEAEKNLFGGFVEHMGRCVYNGLYEPSHPAADEDGFRKDVIDLIRELDMPVTRYPGGNFVSGYDWKDGIGEVSRRPLRAEYAWNALEPNRIGLDEFVKWCKKVNSEILYAVNLNTNTPKSAQELVEYANFAGRGHWSDRRRANGSAEPHGIKLWCLGNEVDGEWQIGHMTAAEYGRVAHETAKMMKMVDPDIRLCACGSSTGDMATFGSWEIEVLRHLFKDVDYLSIHMYFSNRDKDLPKYLSVPEQLDSRLRAAVAACDAVAAEKRSVKKIMIALDEWNVWYRGSVVYAPEDRWQCGKPLNEEIYDMSDVLVVGGALLSMLDNCDRLKIACLAQSVNVIAPIMTVNGGKCWKQTIFYPFRETSRFGRGTVLRSVVDSPVYAGGAKFCTPEIQFLRTAAVWRQEAGEITVFAINRAAEKMEFSAELQGFECTQVIDAIEIANPDMDAVNSAEKEAVAPEKIAADRYSLRGNQFVSELKPLSWNMFRIRVKS
ncbi:MAG: alpha-N-arabinofuranosidase [Lentisphaerae bacterium]|nr:alpha-N-arabinofuranosidase [Lentisphaerota bacterium]